jgi:hypothetical protein
VSDQSIRIAVVIVAVGIAVLTAFIARKMARPVHPDINVGEVGDRPGVVLFTSTDCSNCREAIAVLKGESIPFREVTHDLEPQRFEIWDVVAVPLTVVVDARGNIVDAITGIPKRSAVTRAARSAGIEFG